MLLLIDNANVGNQLFLMLSQCYGIVI